LKEIAIEVSSFGALRQLMRISNMGGEITKAPCEVSIMLNGLRYYSMEVNMENDSYIIQAFGDEAVALYKTAMTLLEEKKILY